MIEEYCTWPIKIDMGTITHSISVESARKLIANIQQQIRVTEQQPPQVSAGDVWQLTISDMEARRKMGIEKYGKPVQPFNGRNQIRDLYEELLDAVVYTRNFEEELKCLGTDLNKLCVQLANLQSQDAGGIADAVSFLNQILSRNPALHVK